MTYPSRSGWAAIANTVDVVLHPARALSRWLRRLPYSGKHHPHSVRRVPLDHLLAPPAPDPDRYVDQSAPANYHRARRSENRPYDFTGEYTVVTG